MAKKDKEKSVKDTKTTEKAANSSVDDVKPAESTTNSNVDSDVKTAENTTNSNVDSDVKTAENATNSSVDSDVIQPIGYLVKLRDIHPQDSYGRCGYRFNKTEATYFAANELTSEQIVTLAEDPWLELIPVCEE